MSEITEQMWKHVDTIIQKYRGKKGALIPVLEECQKVCGYLPMEIQEKVSQGLGVSGAAIYGVVTFYSFFTMAPKGRHTIKVCLGTACYVRGGDENLEHIQKEIGVEGSGTTEDQRFSLEPVRCIGACGMAPAIIVDNDTYAQVSRNNVMDILDSYK